MGRFTLPDPPARQAFMHAVAGALGTDDRPLSPLQDRLLRSTVQRFSGHDPVPGAFEPMPAAEAAALITDEGDRQTLAQLVTVLELVEHPLPPEVEKHTEHYLRDMGIAQPNIEILRDTAQQHLALLHADVLRNSWYTERTIAGIFHGKLLELARSKLAYYGVGTDAAIAERWRGLADCPAGSWGRGVHDFYTAWGFPFPGEKRGIYEIGARHDWVHVLADYDTSPEGEIDVFAFIAGTMTDRKGFVQFIFTLALFQNATIDTVGGKKVAIARADTLDDPVAADRLVDALYRASLCTADPMGGVDLWAHADEPLDELRSRWNVVDKQVPGPGALPAA